MGGGVDVIYLPGKWADYTKELLSSGTQIRFKRDFIGSRGQVFAESVWVSSGNIYVYDKLVFADGAVMTNQAATALIANAQVGISSITGYDAATTTPTNTAGIVNSAGVSLFLSNGGVPMGNGNLMYTVSHDSQSGKHTVRWENYTSFNMPAEIKYGNIGSTQNSMNGTTSDRTLDFVYGPEHQRVKQVVTLSNNAPTSLMGGTTWYLHGDNNSLLYEKEVKANGVTENRHYLQAAGMTFAVAVTRTGAGISAAAADPTKRPTQVEYYQQDHLGSIAAIADENGVVIERLAYDPWGKRRNVNGLSDNADALVGVNTDRGYTMHEHLDEVGVIHMNGRVYDPLIGRFMSADPFIQRSVHAGIRCETFVRCLKANCPNGTTNPDQSTPQPAIRP
jgi:RHS repeat-associated protein